jgi:hypothetical protein
LGTERGCAEEQQEEDARKLQVLPMMLFAEM